MRAAEPERATFRAATACDVSSVRDAFPAGDIHHVPAMASINRTNAAAAIRFGEVFIAPEHSGHTALDGRSVPAC